MMIGAAPEEYPVILHVCYIESKNYLGMYFVHKVDTLLLSLLLLYEDIEDMVSKQSILFHSRFFPSSSSSLHSGSLSVFAKDFPFQENATIFCVWRVVCELPLPYVSSYTAPYLLSQIFMIVYNKFGFPDGYTGKIYSNKIIIRPFTQTQLLEAAAAVKS